MDPHRRFQHPTNRTRVLKIQNVEGDFFLNDSYDKLSDENEESKDLIDK